MDYQSKYHKYVCEGLRWVSFATMMLTLFLFLLDLWMSYDLTHLTYKMFATSIAVMFISAMTAIIFYQPKDKTD